MNKPTITALIEDLEKARIEVRKLSDRINLETVESRATLVPLDRAWSEIKSAHASLTTATNQLKYALARLVK